MTAADITPKETKTEYFVGSFCSCPECGSKDIWVLKDYSIIRCASCGYSEESKK